MQVKWLEVKGFSSSIAGSTSLAECAWSWRSIWKSGIALPSYCEISFTSGFSMIFPSFAHNLCGVCHKCGYASIIHFNGMFRYKPSIWGYCTPIYGNPISCWQLGFSVKSKCHQLLGMKISSTKACWKILCFWCSFPVRKIHLMGGSIVMGFPLNWMVYKGNPIKNGWFRATPISGNLHLGHRDFAAMETLGPPRNLGHFPECMGAAWRSRPLPELLRLVY